MTTEEICNSEKRGIIIDTLVKVADSLLRVFKRLFFLKEKEPESVFTGKKRYRLFEKQNYKNHWRFIEEGFFEYLETGKEKWGVSIYYLPGGGGDNVARWILIEKDVINCYFPNTTPEIVPFDHPIIKKGKFEKHV